MPAWYEMEKFASVQARLIDSIGFIKKDVGVDKLYVVMNASNKDAKGIWSGTYNQARLLFQHRMPRLKFQRVENEAHGQRKLTENGYRDAHLVKARNMTGLRPFPR
jgi:hypothetical protein